MYSPNTSSPNSGSYSGSYPGDMPFLSLSQSSQSSRRSSFSNIDAVVFNDEMEQELAKLRELFNKKKAEKRGSGSFPMAGSFSNIRRDADPSAIDLGSGKVHIHVLKSLAPMIAHYYEKIRNESHRMIPKDGIKLEWTDEGMYVRIGTTIGLGSMKSVREQEELLSKTRVVRAKATVTINTNILPCDLASLTHLAGTYAPKTTEDSFHLIQLKRLIQELHIVHALEQKRVQSASNEWPFPKFYGFSIHSKKSSVSQGVVIKIQIRMEKFDGSLNQLDTSTLSEKQIFSMIEQIASGFAILEKGFDGKPIYHRDLKRENILFKKEGDRYRVVISDFDTALGLDKFLMDNVNFRGTLANGSPEAVFKFEYQKEDCYALGLLFYRLLFHQKPNALNHFESLIEMLEDEPIKSNCAPLQELYQKENTEELMALAIREDLKEMPGDSQLIRLMKPVLRKMIHLSPTARLDASTLQLCLKDVRSHLQYEYDHI